MTYYLGRPGALIALPDPEAGLSMPTERIGGMHQLLSGAKVRDTLGFSRSWQLSWTVLDLDSYGVLEGFLYGAYGRGPYYLLDPEQRNFLAANVASAGDVSSDGNGVTVAGNCTLARSLFYVTQYYDPGTWQVAEGATGAGQAVLTADAIVPVVPGLQYTIAADIHVDSAAPAHHIQVAWMDATATSATYGYLDGNTIAAGTTARSHATGTAPAGAVYAQIRLATDTANTSGGTVYVYTNNWQFEQAAGMSNWTPGIGVPLVTVDSLSKSVPISGRADAQMTIVQVR